MRDGPAAPAAVWVRGRVAGANRQGRVRRFEGFVKQVSSPGVEPKREGTQRSVKINSASRAGSWPKIRGRARHRPDPGPWLLPGSPVGLMG
ncbi:hypothetical protein GCM10010360_09890 [Streptomyces nogalater]